MRKVLREQQILCANIPSEANDWFDVLHTDCSSGSLLESYHDPYSRTILELQTLARGNIPSDFDNSVKLQKSYIEMLPPIYEGVLNH